ncbi:hypothetical protein ABBQ32_010764 [Trebouxia sp. C0010 RCD-2024]
MRDSSGLSAVQSGDIQNLLNLLRSEQAATQHQAVKGLSLLMNTLPEAAQAIDAKVASGLLCQQLSAPAQEVQIAAASTLTALAKEGSENQMIIARAGVLPLLIQQMTATDTLVQTTAVTALAHLTAGQQPVASWLLSKGAIKHIQQLLQSAEVELQLAAIEAIDSAAASDLQVRSVVGNVQTLTTLINLLEAPYTKTQQAAASALANMALTSRDGVNVDMVRCNAAAALVAKLDPLHAAVCHQAARALCNLSGDNDECDDMISRTNAVPALAQLFHCSNARIVAAAGKALGNLALFSVANQEAIADSGVIDACITLISCTATAHVKEASCRLLHVLLTDSPRVHTLLSGNGTDKLTDLLNSPSVSVRHAAAGALSHLLFPRNMPGWQENNELVNRRNMMSIFQDELDSLRAANKTAHSGDMVMDQLNDICLNNGGQVSASARESQGTASSESDQDNESVTGMEDDFQEMHV